MAYVVVNERVLESAFAVGPFDTAEAAEKWADAKHEPLQVWEILLLDSQH
jgi:hypothetical protein